MQLQAVVRAAATNSEWAKDGNAGKDRLLSHKQCVLLSKARLQVLSSFGIVFNLGHFGIDGRKYLIFR